jgi:hypothetical protein
MILSFPFFSNAQCVCDTGYVVDHFNENGLNTRTSAYSEKLIEWQRDSNRLYVYEVYVPEDYLERYAYNIREVYEDRKTLTIEVIRVNGDDIENFIFYKHKTQVLEKNNGDYIKYTGKKVKYNINTLKE